MDGTLEWEPSIHVISNPFFCKNFVIAMKRAPLSNPIFFNLQNTGKEDGEGKVPRVNHRGDLGSEGVHSWVSLNHNCSSPCEPVALHDGFDKHQL